MLNLKEFASIPTYRLVTEDDRNKFKTLWFDPEELFQLKEMNHQQLRCLMLFCGIRVFNGVPIDVLEGDEMRMAFVIWRAQKIEEKKAELLPKAEEGMKWINWISKAVQTLTNY